MGHSPGKAPYNNSITFVPKQETQKSEVFVMTITSLAGVRMKFILSSLVITHDHFSLLDSKPNTTQLI